MNAGRFCQVADARTVYDDPRDLLTAQFVGDAVLVDGVADGDHADCVFGRVPLRRADVRGPATVMIRPEQLRIIAAAPGESAHARVLSSEYYGHDSAVWLELGDPARHRVTARLAGSDRFANGAGVRLAIDGSAIAFAKESSTA
jgi:iron(III) transport system ATP-binding protein